MAEVTALAGGSDVLVNNAGVVHVGVAEETTMEDARAGVETNWLTELQGGMITAGSTVGKRSVFSVWLQGAQSSHPE